jgi:SAM-dependent methyltransferase
VLLTVDLERLDVGTTHLMLDVGCGEGRHCFGALERGARVVGIDQDKDALGFANKPLQNRAREKDSLGEMLCANAFQLPFRDNTFDRVICSEVMEHVHDYTAACAEISRVTKPGGIVGITIPTKTSELMYRHLGDEYFESPGGHIRIFKPTDLRDAMTKAGLRNRGVGFAHGFHTFYWVLRSIAGLPAADESKLVQAYRLFLIRVTGSAFMDKLEGILNYVCPKSLILYAQKP